MIQVGCISLGPAGHEDPKVYVEPKNAKKQVDYSKYLDTDGDGILTVAAIGAH